MRKRKAPDPLSAYRAKRRFDETPEPAGRSAKPGSHLYAIQKHAARRLHYDLRLELDGVLKSWAITRGPSLDPTERRLAVRTEDHPVEYATFEGSIPAGNYGAGTVLLWDHGTWTPLSDPHRGLKRGKLEFSLNGKRLKGQWALIRFKGQDRERRENWLLIKKRDAEAESGHSITEESQTSVASGRDMSAIAAAPTRVWQPNRASDDTAPGAKTRRGSGRRRAHQPALPGFTPPALATLVDAVPDSEGWLFEMKFDGYRALIAGAGNTVRIYTRNGLDWTARYPGVASAVAALNLEGALLDGEIVVLDENGRSDFGALQRALKGQGGAPSFFAFDLLEHRGKDLRRLPLVERKEKLRDMLGGARRTGPIFFADHIGGHGKEMLDSLCGKGFEGIIAKRADAPYRGGRTRAWLKIKCDQSQEFVIVGWSPSTRGRPFSSLLLAVQERGGLRYAGRVGTGFSQADLEELSERFRPASARPVTGKLPAGVPRNVRWIEPTLVANIGFAEFTRDGLVRQGRFLGLREDKPAQAVVRERPQHATQIEQQAAEPAKTAFGGVRLSHPDKVLYPQQGVTKREVALYLDAVAERMLPFAADRLLSLVRCPEGRSKQCFFQRHGGRGLSDLVRQHPVRERRGGQKDYLYIDNAAGLFAAAQMGVLEFHIWGSPLRNIEKPDRIVFDLDPDPAISFDAVKESAYRLRDVLEALDLRSFPLLTGGKGVHVVVPVTPGHEWPIVKDFARALAERLVQDEPGRYVATMRKAKRQGRIFIDHFRNERGATAIAPYSPRARSGAPVAWPVSWDELDGTRSAGDISIRTAAERLGGTDPWREYRRTRQRLKRAALRALGL